MLLDWHAINGPDSLALTEMKEWTNYQDIDPLASVHYIYMKPLVNSYIQKLVQTKWDVSVHSRDLYLMKSTLGPPKKFQHFIRVEEVVITRLRIGHTKAIKSHILSRGPPTGCHHCGQTLTICCWSVHCCRNVVMNTTHSTHWMFALGQFLRLA